MFSLATVSLIIVVVSLTIMHAEYVKWSKIPISRLPTIPTISSQRFDNLDESSIFTKEPLKRTFQNLEKGPPHATVRYSNPFWGKPHWFLREGLRLNHGVVICVKTLHNS